MACCSPFPFSINIALATVLVAITSTNTRAQTPADGGAQMLPPTVVTANRIETERSSIGSAISVITRDTLRQHEATGLAEVLRTVPGLAVSRNGPVGQLTQIRIRGAESNHTLVLIDGIEVTDPSNFSQEFDFSSLQTHEIERVEILRGPQAALWGSDAIGGVINIITRRGDGPAQFKAQAQTGSFTTHQASAGVSGGSNQFHYAFSGSHLTTNGVNAAESGTEEDGYENTTVTFRGGFSPLSSLDVDVVARYTNALVEFDSQVAGVVVDSASFSESHQRFGKVQMRWEPIEGVWRHRLSAARSDHDTAGMAGAFPTLNEGRKFKYEYETNAFFSTNAFLDAEHALTLLFESERDEFLGGGFFAPVGRSRDTLSYVAQYALDLFQQVHMSAAVRHDDNDISKDATTYRFAGAFTPTGWNTRFHASYGEGVKNPTMFELFGFTPTFVGNPNLTPESSKGWDLGIEQGLLDGRLKVDLTYFRNRIVDEIAGFGTTAINQVGVSRSKGVEFALRAQPSSALSIGAAYTLTNTENPTGLEQVRRPKHVGSFDVDYTFADRKARLHLGLIYNGKQKDLDFRPGGSRVTLQDYWLLNVNGSYRINRVVEVFGRVENLLDEEYTEIFSFNTPGVAAFAGVRVNFDGVAP